MQFTIHKLTKINKPKTEISHTDSLEKSRLVFVPSALHFLSRSQTYLNVVVSLFRSFHLVKITQINNNSNNHSNNKSNASYTTAILFRRVNFFSVRSSCVVYYADWFLVMVFGYHYEHL